MCITTRYLIFFFFNDTATTEIYTLSLHDALPICVRHSRGRRGDGRVDESGAVIRARARTRVLRSEEHTSELQSQSNLVCRLLLEKKTNIDATPLLRCKDNRGSSPLPSHMSSRRST